MSRRNRERIKRKLQELPLPASLEIAFAEIESHGFDEISKTEKPKKKNNHEQ